MRSRSILALATLATAIVVSQAFAKGERLDPSFGEHGISGPAMESSQQQAEADDMVLEPGGGIVVLGLRGYAGSSSVTQTAFGFTADGQIDTSFGKAGSTDFLPGDLEISDPVGVAVHKKILVAGVAQDARKPGPFTLWLARLLPNGELDRGFGAHGVVDTGLVHTGDVFIAATPNGRIVAAISGPTDPVYGVTGVLVARFLPDGSPDRSFSHDGKVVIADPRAEGMVQGPLVAFKGGGVVAAAYADIGGGDPRGELFELTARGRLDKHFGRHGFATLPNALSMISDLALGPHRRLIAVGSSDNSNRTSKPVVTAFKKGGHLDREFGRDGAAQPRAAGLGGLTSVVVRPSGVILAAGYGNMNPYALQGVSDALLVQMKANGKPDGSFAEGGVVTTDIDGSAELYSAVAVQPTGRIVAAGNRGRTFAYFTEIAGPQIMLAGYRDGR